MAFDGFRSGCLGYINPAFMAAIQPDQILFLPVMSVAGLSGDQIAYFQTQTILALSLEQLDKLSPAGVGGLHGDHLIGLVLKYRIEFVDLFSKSKLASSLPSQIVIFKSAIPYTVQPIVETNWTSKEVSKMSWLKFSLAVTRPNYTTHFLQTILDKTISGMLPSDVLSILPEVWTALSPIQVRPDLFNSAQPQFLNLLVLLNSGWEFSE